MEPTSERVCESQVQLQDYLSLTTCIDQKIKQNLIDKAKLKKEYEVYHCLYDLTKCTNEIESTSSASVLGALALSMTSLKDVPHSSVVVGDREFSYGNYGFKISIFGSQSSKPTKKQLMGTINMSLEEVEEIARRVAETGDGISAHKNQGRFEPPTQQLPPLRFGVAPPITNTDPEYFERPPPKSSSGLFNPRGGNSRGSGNTRNGHMLATNGLSVPDSFSDPKMRGDAVASAVLVNKLETLKVSDSSASGSPVTIEAEAAGNL